MMIENNPFYALGLTCKASRREIMAAAEEMSFSLDQDMITEAQNTLINPNRRLSAELDWFLDVSDAQVRAIRHQIETGVAMATDSLSGLSRLNATLYNFSISKDNDLYDLGYAILDIDEQFSSLDTDTIVSQINACRIAAKMPEVQVITVSQELNKKRESIRQTVSEKLTVLEKESFIELMTLLAEKLCDSEENEGVVIADIIDQYEIRMQSELERCTDEINSQFAKIKSLSNTTAVRTEIESLIKKVKAWDKMAQPLQLKSQASGMPHEMSEDLGHKLRDFAFLLHNEKSMSQEALMIVDAMVGIFRELDGLAEKFREDSDALKDLIKSETEAKAVLDELTSQQKEAESLKSFATEISVNSFITRVCKLDKTIKSLALEEPLGTQIRENLCYMARDVAITLHNNKSQTEYALKIANALQTEFSDISSLRAKLTEDCNSLKQQLAYKQLAQQRQAQQEAAQRSKNIGCLVVIGIVVVIWLISSLGGGSKKPTSTSSSYSPSRTTVTATAVPEKRFSTSSTAGSKVYVDIVSIFPSIGIYTEGSSNYKNFVCECRTSSGTTVWVYMTVSEYRSYFDSDASSSIYNDYADEVTFSSGKRIHGTVKTANSVMAGLSSDTGTYVIDFSSFDK